MHSIASAKRRRRASRSAGTSPQRRSPRSLSQASRRASSTAEDSSDDEYSPVPPRQRSPRASLTPEAALEGYNRSPRHSLVPGDYRTPRTSITPDAYKQPNRNNLVVDKMYGSRLSLDPQYFNRSPRNSLTPDATARSPRRSLIPEGIHFNNPRYSLITDVAGFPMHSIPFIQTDSVRNLNGMGQTSRTSPRGSVAEHTGKTKLVESYRSPRGSLIPDSQRSHRGSLAQSERSARGSLVASEGDVPRTSPRGSVTLTFKEPPAKDRRSSADSQGAGRGRATPYRSSLGARQGASNVTEVASRRASSSISQMSGEEQRRAYAERAAQRTERDVLGLNLGLSTYSCVANHLRDASMEARSTGEFMCRALRILNRTIIMTVVLATMSMIPILMTALGFHYKNECPAEPKIPLYMAVGGIVQGLGIMWLIWSQYAHRRTDSKLTFVEGMIGYLLLFFTLAWFACGNIWVLGIMWPKFAPSRKEPNGWCNDLIYHLALYQLAFFWCLIGLVVVGLSFLAISKALKFRWLGPNRHKR